jgi:hypothetical protein
MVRSFPGCCARAASGHAAAAPPRTRDASWVLLGQGPECYHAVYENVLGYRVAH